MVWKVEVQRVGDGLGVILPNELVERFELKERDQLSATPTADGFVIRFVSDEAETMAAFEKIHREFHDVFRRLADS